jgi:hypothetical protein
MYTWFLNAGKLFQNVFIIELTNFLISLNGIQIDTIDTL